MNDAVNNQNETGCYDFTIIVPIYNEIGNMTRLEENLKSFLPKSILSTCVLLIDDGSSDGSREKIEDICKRNEHFYYIVETENGGLSVALKVGFDHTFSRYLGYMDADMQTNVEDFNLLLPYIVEYEMVTGIRINRKDSAFKRWQSRVANSFRRRMTGDGIQDTGCPLKVLRTGIAKNIPMFDGMHRFLPALVMLQGGKVKQVPVRSYPRTAGKSKYSLGNRLKGPFIDCFAYRWMKKRYIRYGVGKTNLH